MVFKKVNVCLLYIFVMLQIHYSLSLCCEDDQVILFLVHVLRFIRYVKREVVVTFRVKILCHQIVWNSSANMANVHNGSNW